jgi:predicted nucleic-acid-binding protein
VGPGQPPCGGAARRGLASAVVRWRCEVVHTEAIGHPGQSLRGARRLYSARGRCTPPAAGQRPGAAGATPFRGCRASLDTNVLARFFIDDADDAQVARQRPAAVAALAERSFVSVTVLLELEWVMRGFYELPTRDISRVLRALAGIEHITLEDRDAVLVAVDAFDKGLDFAGALHLARSSRACGFATFDRRLARRAKGLALTPPVELLG